MAVTPGNRSPAVYDAAPRVSLPVSQEPGRTSTQQREMNAVMFSEGDGHWSAVPSWAGWFLRFGYFWSVESGKRRICVLSTPCDSPAAGLIALGLMRRRLEEPDARDLALHLSRLRDLYVRARERTILRRVNNRKRFCFSKADADGTLWAHIVGDTSQRFRIVEEFAFDWHVDGEPPVQITRGAPMTPTPILHSLFYYAGPVLPENLARTDSAICLAGRAAGESQTQEALFAVQFQQDGETSSLGSLLTIHGWHDGRVSRVAFYNTRTRELDRAGRLPLVVCADGVASCARVLADSHFAGSDLIAAVPRTSDPEQIEAVAQQLASLSQWYTPEDSTIPSVGHVPSGVTVVTLGKD